jgi:hypothetical protein
MTSAAARMIAMMLLVAGLACDRSTRAGGGFDADGMTDTRPDQPFGVDAGPPDLGAEPSCGALCGMIARVQVDATCTFTIRCPPIGDFTGLAISIDGVEIARDPATGWEYTDDTMSAVVLHGQACSDALSGAATIIAISYTCGAP